MSLRLLKPERARAVLLPFLLCLLLIAALAEPAPVCAFRTEPIASYVIDVTLDSEAKTLTAHEVVSYTNMTDEPIPDLVFHLYLNAFSRPNTVFMQESGFAQRGSAWDPQQAGSVDVLDITLADGTQLMLEEIEDGTLARADLPVPVAPGESVAIELDFQAQLPRVLARTGYVDEFFMVGQWFPKLGVWEDGGWNAHPFHANAEFYADFGTYDVSITVPSEYVTGATGLPIATEDNADGTKTVRYRAEDVIDFAWTASPFFSVKEFRWSFDEFCAQAPNGMGGRVTELLERTAAHLGLPVEKVRPDKEVLGKKCHEVLFGNKQPCMEGTETCPTTAALSSAKIGGPATFLRQAQAGKQQYLRVHSQPIRDAGGAPRYAIEFIQDGSSGAQAGFKK